MKNYGIDLCDLLLLNFFIRPNPAPELAGDHVGLTEKEIRDKYQEVNVLPGLHTEEQLLEIRLADATLTCRINASHICEKAYLFTDDEA